VAIVNAEPVMNPATAGAIITCQPYTRSEIKEVIPGMNSSIKPMRSNPIPKHIIPQTKARAVAI